MKCIYRIGSVYNNDIRIKDNNSPILHAEIRYSRGHWVLYNLIESNPIYLNEELVRAPKNLVK